MRLTDADLLAEEITASSIANQAYIEYHAGSEWAKLIKLIYNSALKEILNAPTVDAVPVVRCKDCKHWIPFPDLIHPNVEDCEIAYCTLHSIHFETPREGYCYRAERRKDGID